MRYDSEIFILLILFWCRPPSNSVCIKISTIKSASSKETNLEGIHKILALLCWRINLTMSVFQQIPARIFLYLLAVIATPFALPQSSIPKSDSLLDTALATG